MFFPWEFQGHNRHSPQFPGICLSLWCWAIVSHWILLPNKSNQTSWDWETTWRPGDVQDYMNDAHQTWLTCFAHVPFSKATVHYKPPHPPVTSPRAWREGWVRRGSGEIVVTTGRMLREVAALLTGVSEDLLGILTGRMESSQCSSLPDDTAARHALMAHCHFLQHLRCHPSY